MTRRNKNEVVVGSTGVIVEFRVYSLIDGTPVTGLVAADFSGTFSKGNAADVAITFVDGSVGDAYSVGKVAEKANGRYLLHTPNGSWDTVNVDVEFDITVTDGIVVFASRTVVPQFIDSNLSRVLDETIVAGDEINLVDVNKIAALETRLIAVENDTNELQTNQSNWLTATEVTVSAASQTSIASAVRTNLAIELGRIDENVSAAKTLTAATMASLFDDTDAAQQLSDFFAGLVERFDEAGDVPVSTIAATTIAQLFLHSSMIELLADAEAARAQAVANGSAIGDLPDQTTVLARFDNVDSGIGALPDSTAMQSAAAAAIGAATLPNQTFIEQELGELQSHGDANWVTGSGGSGGATAQDIVDQIERGGGMLDGIRSVLAGITSLSNWLRGLLRSSNVDAVTLAEINTGGGTYDPMLHSGEAISDQIDELEQHGDQNWVGGGGGGGGASAAEIVDEMVSRFGSTLEISQPVSPHGEIEGPLVIGDDYLEIHNRAFVFTVSAVPGQDITECSCQFGMARDDKGSFMETGTLSDNGDGTWNMSFDVPKGSSSSFEAGLYEWSAQVVDSDENEITRARNVDEDYRVRWVEKQT